MHELFAACDDRVAARDDDETKAEELTSALIMLLLPSLFQLTI